MCRHSDDSALACDRDRARTPPPLAWSPQAAHRETFEGVVIN